MCTSLVALRGRSNSPLAKSLNWQCRDTWETTSYSVPHSSTGAGPAAVPFGTRDAGGRDGLTDQRLAWTAVYYPQPWGLQVEWTVGRGPELNAAQTAVEVESLSGGYAMLMYQLEDFHGTWIPFGRYSFYDGGYKSATNSPKPTYQNSILASNGAKTRNAIQYDVHIHRSNKPTNSRWWQTLLRSIRRSITAYAASNKLLTSQRNN